MSNPESPETQTFQLTITASGVVDQGTANQGEES